ncbi:MAG: formylmethanofuran dehydrogenase subunit A [Gammaproteobacteria bacterium RIFCSPLOWO2_01_FULL_47_190]|nr:MAG: formylmethanofuran dehydrogenase subunit A [Gammaproteobacteria bacterium RIFCSPLOWO2_01_FULL_47_190]
MTFTTRIVNGKVYDPMNNIDGEIRDICIEDGRIVESMPDDASRIDAGGMVIMPGGIDIHCHIAGAKVNAGRKLMPEDHRRDPHPETAFTRSGTGGIVPSTFATGYRYATLGYTTAMEAAVPPITARHTLEELDCTPIIDKGFYVLLGNNIFLHNLLREGRHEEFRQTIAWWVNATKAYTTKLVNPCGDEPWKGQRNKNITDIDEKVDGISPRIIIEAFVNAVNAMGFPHPPHIHCNNLGHSGNYKTTLETMRTAGDQRLHVAHIQFHSYGGVTGKNPTSKAAEIIEYVNQHPNITCDIGQVMFGNATIMTADAPLAYVLRGFNKNKWVNADTECESGCGILPFTYQEHVYTHTMQWAIGLEMFLLSEDPWRVILSTDHPNGGSFMNYPKLIRLLMDKSFRREEMGRVNQKAIAKTALNDLDREYTLNEIAIITRAGPARALGLKNKGHLGPGADADITIYDEMEDKEMMFNAPRYVIKSGIPIIADHEFRGDHTGRLLHITPEYDQSIEETVKPFFESFYSVEFGNYAIDDSYMHDHEVIQTTKTS